MCVFTGEAGEPLAEVTESAASTKAIITFRHMREVCGESRASLVYPSRSLLPSTSPDAVLSDNRNYCCRSQSRVPAKNRIAKTHQRLALVTFDPNILAHSALVTTDIGVSLFFLAGIIDYGVMVYRGTFQVNLAAALSRAQIAYTLLGNGKASEALAMAREAVSVDPEEIISLTALGDIAAVQGQKRKTAKHGRPLWLRQSRWNRMRR